MKTRLKHLSKSTVSVLLALMMIISTFTVGIVATNAEFSDNESVGTSSSHFDLNIHNGSNTYNYDITVNPDSSKSQYYVDATLKQGWTFDLDNSIGSGGTQYGNNNDTDYEITSNLTYHQFDSQYKYNGSKWSWNSSGTVIKRFLIDQDTSEWYPRVWMSDSPMNSIGLYVKGSFNNWQQNNAYLMTQGSDSNVSSVTFDVPGSARDYEFKLQNVSAGNDGYIYDKNDVTFSSDGAYSDSLRSGSGGANMKLRTIKTSGTVRVTMTYYKEYSGKPRLIVNQTEVANTYTATLSDGGSVGGVKTAIATLSGNSQTTSSATGSITGLASGSTVTIKAYPASGKQANITASSGTLSSSVITSSGGEVTLTMPSDDVTVTIGYSDATGEAVNNWFLYKGTGEYANPQNMTKLSTQLYKSGDVYYAEITPAELNGSGATSFTTGYYTFAISNNSDSYTGIRPVYNSSQGYQVCTTAALLDGASCALAGEKAAE